MELLSRLLQSKKLEYEDLTPEEKKVFLSWQSELEKKEIKPDDVITKIKELKDIVTAELVDTPQTERDKNLYLKGRLKNLLLLEAFFTGPEKAKKALSTYIESQTTK